MLTSDFRVQGGPRDDHVILYFKRQSTFILCVRELAVFGSKHFPLETVARDAGSTGSSHVLHHALAWDVSRVTLFGASHPPAPHPLVDRASLGVAEWCRHSGPVWIGRHSGIPFRSTQALPKNGEPEETMFITKPEREMSATNEMF